MFSRKGAKSAKGGSGTVRGRYNYLRFPGDFEGLGFPFPVRDGQGLG